MKKRFYTKKCNNGNKIKCDSCGRHFVPGNDSIGIPNGVSFITEDNLTITLCSKCIMDPNTVNKFLSEVKK